MLVNLRQDAGEVMLTRDQLAERMGCAPKNVNTAMSILECMGVTAVSVGWVEGMQGRGMAVYFINPHIAWNGSLDIRKAEGTKAKPPRLTLMQNTNPV